MSAQGSFLQPEGFVSLFCTGCRLQTPIPTRETTAPGQKNRHNDLHPHMAQGKTVITGVLQTTRILAVQGDIHIPIQVLARGGCTASVPVPAAFPWMRHADLHSLLDGPDALPCLPAWLCSAAALHPGAATSSLSKFQTCTKVLTATFLHDKKL